LLTQCLAHFTQPTVHPLPIELQLSKRSLYRFNRTLIGTVATVFALAIAAGWLLSRKSDNPVTAPVNVSRQASSSSTETAPTNEDLELPWRSPDAASDWNDNLSPLFQHIEKSLNPIPTPPAAAP